MIPPKVISLKFPFFVFAWRTFGTVYAFTTVSDLLKPVGGQSIKKAHVVEDELMERESHCIQKDQISESSTYDKWFLAGTAIPTHTHLILAPDTPYRMGALWHKEPLDSDNFQVDFTFSATGSATSTIEQGFAFWYVYDNATEEYDSVKDLLTQGEKLKTEWQTPLAEAGFDLFGYRSKFDGLGVIFSNLWPETRGVDPTKRLQPSISVVVSYGEKEWTLWNEMPLENAAKVNYRTGSLIDVKVRVQPESVSVSVDGNNIFDSGSASPPTMRSGGYIGFSSLTKDCIRKEPESEVEEPSQQDSTAKSEADSSDSSKQEESSAKSDGDAPPSEEATKSPPVRPCAVAEDGKIQAGDMIALTHVTVKAPEEPLPPIVQDRIDELLKKLEKMQNEIKTLQRTQDELEYEKKENICRTDPSSCDIDEET